MKNTANVFPDAPLAISEGLAEKAAETPSLDMILRGRTMIVPLDGNTNVFKSVGNFSGRSSTYEITFPGYRHDGTDWTTWITDWKPDHEFEGYRKAPPRSLSILTGRGEIPYSLDLEVITAVVAEAHRQEDEFRAAQA